MYCKNLLKRQKHYKVVFYCKELKEYINSLSQCKNCSKLILKRNKPIKKVSANRVFVSQGTYNQVFNRDKGKCRLCGSNNIQLHHIIYRSEDKSKINDIDNCIMLCFKCHELVHSNKHYWQPKLQELIRKERNEREQNNSNSNKII